MEAGGIFQHLPALFQVMGLKCAKYDSKAQKDSKRDMAVVPALIRQSLCEKACKAMFLFSFVVQWLVTEQPRIARSVTC